jgi:hypothetical protein
MKQINLLFIIISLLFSCNRETKKEDSSSSITEAVIEDTTPKVTGIGAFSLAQKIPQK